MNMAATLFRMTVEECLIGVTRAGAQALGIQDRAGTLEAGKSLRPRHLEYRTPGGARLSHGFQSAARACMEGRVTTPSHHEWLSVHHGDAPLIVSFPHTGIEIPDKIEANLVSPWLARKDTDFWVDVLYDFAHELGATTIRTALSRTVIDVNRDPSGASLYPGQATTGLCPLETFDGEPLYKSGSEAGAAEFLRRRAEYFDPYHSALSAELERKRAQSGCVVLYDAHSIRSRVPRLFDGELPQFNIGTNNGMTCAPDLTALDREDLRCLELHAVSPMAASAAAGSRGITATRPRAFTPCKWSSPCAAICTSPKARSPEANWPVPLDDVHAARLRVALRDILDACITFAKARSRS